VVLLILQAPELCVALVAVEEASMLCGTDVVSIELSPVGLVFRIPEVGDIGRIENAGGSGVGCI
jgi:hypothetical protein